ncbi:MAG: hypothetical protein ACI9OJ_005607 [Myxococcota bacterium]|jgi:hypothetical protein
MAAQMKKITTGLAALTVLLASGCTADVQESVDGISVERAAVDAMEIVRVSGTTAPWSVDTLLQIGSPGLGDTPAPDEFGRVTSVALGPDGLIYVADAINREIRVFDRSGAFVRALGRQGEGPGEFGGVQAIAWAGSTLLSMDSNVGRIGEWSVSGEWLGQRPHPGRVSGSPTLIRFYLSESGTPYSWSLRPRPTGSERVYVRQGADSSGDTTGQKMANLDGPAAFVVCEEASGGITTFPIPFMPFLRQTPADGGHLVLTDGADYRIAWVGPEGDTVRVLERQVEPDLVDAAQWGEEVQPFLDFKDERSDARCRPARMDRPTAKPAILELYHDGTGNLWVETWRAGVRWFDVYDSELQPLRTVPAPAPGRVTPYLSDLEALVVVTDSLDVQYVQLLRFQPPA